MVFTITFLGKYEQLHPTANVSNATHHFPVKSKMYDKYITDLYNDGDFVDIRVLEI